MADKSKALEVDGTVTVEPKSTRKGRERQSFSFSTIPWSYIAGVVGFLVVLYGIFIGYFIALFEIALAVRGTDYISAHASPLRTSDPPEYGSQPAFPWQVIQAHVAALNNGSP